MIKEFFKKKFQNPDTGSYHSQYRMTSFFAQGGHLLIIVLR